MQPLSVTEDPQVRKSRASSPSELALKHSAQSHAVAAAEAIRRGSKPDAQRAFGHFHALLFDRIFLYVRRELRHTENRDARAEELTNDVFLDFWAQLGRFDPTRGEALHLLYRIARNKARKSWVRAAIQGHYEQKLDLRTDEASDLENHADAERSASQLVDQVEQAQQENNRQLLLEQLRHEYPAQSELLSLRYEEDINASDLSQRLGIEPAAVRKRIETARLTLFCQGWRWIREHAPPWGEQLPAYAPKTPRELQSLMEQDHRVRECFMDAFGTVDIS